MNQPSNAPARTKFGEHRNGDLIEYPPMSGKGLLGMVLGFASCLALVSPLFWFLPLIGAVVSVVALREVHVSAVPRRGATVARIGLALAVLFGSAGLSRQASHLWWVRREARQFGALWFQLLTNDQPQKAYQLLLRPAVRQPLDENLWEYYERLAEARSGLEKFVRNPLVRALLALDGKVRIRYWGTGQSERLEGPLFSPTIERISQFYALTYDNRRRTDHVFCQVVGGQDRRSGYGRSQLADCRLQGGGAAPRGLSCRSTGGLSANPAPLASGRVRVDASRTLTFAPQRRAP